MENVKKKKDFDILNGKLFGKVIWFTLPIMLTNLLQVFYSAADMIVVGLSSEPDAVGAVGTTGAFINLIVNLLIGFSLGANVVVANRLGAGDKVGTSKAVHNAYIISVIFGIFFGAIGVLVSTPVLSLMGNRDNLLTLSARYTMIYFAGAIFISLTNVGSAIFRAKGDSKTPLVVMALSGVINIGLNLFFVLVVGLSVEGVAIATVASNAFNAIVLMIILSRDKGECKLTIKGLKIDKDIFKRIIAIGLPSGLQGSLFAISNMLIQSSVLKVNNILCPAGSDYQAVVKGNSAGISLENFVYVAQNAVYQTAVSFVGQNYGAKKYDRIKTIRNNCYFVGVIIAVVFSMGLTIFRAPFLSLYGVVDTGEGTLGGLAYYASETRILYMFLPYFTVPFMDVGSGVLRGMGKSTTSAIIVFCGACLFRIIWIFTVFNFFPTLEIIYLSYPISWTLTALISFIVGANLVNNKIKEEKTTE